MSRDLFADAYTRRQSPKRSRWTIAGSFVAHVAAVGALLIVPVLSAADRFVVKAKVIFVPPPPPTIPATPPPPAAAPKGVLADVNPESAPAFASEKPVVGDPPPPGSYGPVPPGLVGTGPASPTGLLPGGGVTSLAPPPVAKQLEPLRLGGDIKAPARITYSPPVYPTIAQTAKVEGTVILEATIDESGVVRDVRVLRSIPLLDRAAIEAVSKWRYTPTRLNGVPVAILMTVTVTFNLR